MSYVVDASVAVKWFVREALHEEALALIDPNIQLTAPDLIVCETTNAAWKKCIRGEITTPQATAIAGGITSFFSMLHPPAVFNERALQIGLQLRHPVYDCLYIACAETNESPLITDDRRLIDAVKDTGFEKIIVHLSDFDRPATLS